MALKWFFLIVALCLLHTADANAAAPCGPSVRRVALVIGTNAYPKARLDNAVRDSEMVARSLTNIGFEVATFTDTSRSQLLQVLQEFSAKLRELCESDIALFYYAGRGAEIRRMGFLFTTDMDVNAYYADANKEAEQLAKAVQLSEVLEAFEAHAGPKIVIIDTCRVDVHHVQRLRTELVRATNLRVPDNTLLAYATEPLTFASDGPAGGNGPYALALTAQLSQPALPVEVFFKRVRKAVEAQTATLGKDHQQRPFIDAGAFYSEVNLGRETGSADLATATTSVCKQVERPAKRLAGGKAPTRQERKVALVIGVSNYTNLNRLTNPYRDAEAMAKSLCRLGFAEVIVAQDPDQVALIHAVTEFEALAARADWGVIYYAGHAVEMDGNTYLIPADAEFERDLDVPDETYSLNRLLNKLNKATQLRLVIVDACRDDPFPDRQALRATRFRGELKSSLGQPDPGDAVLVVYSTKHGSTASDGTGKPNGPYAQALLDLINQPLEMDMLFRRVRDQVKKATNGAQLPYTYGSLPGRPIYFRAP